MEQLISDKLKLGVIGLSDGNGHPYSWSAIFNGYDRPHMAKCPFPVIPEYLFEHKYPTDFLNTAIVSHIWTEDLAASEQVAKAANIPHVVKSLEDMITKVDGVLLARDDAENHLKYAAPVLRAGLPVYIDKPFAHSVADAEHLLSLQSYSGQIYTCSALRYADELMLSERDRNKLGKIREIEAITPKSWKKYSAHIIEPVLREIGPLLSDSEYSLSNDGQIVNLTVRSSEGVVANFSAYGNTSVPITITYRGDCEIKLIFKDTFNCFKRSLDSFVKSVQNNQQIISSKDTLAVVRIIEAGLS